jgi:putative ABC transport system permease protein
MMSRLAFWLALRMAFGADRRGIMRLLLGEGLKPAGLGVIVGIAVARPVTRLLRALLFDVTAADPATVLIVSFGLMLLAAAACYLPTRRTFKVHAAEALRFD